MNSTGESTVYVIDDDGGMRSSLMLLLKTAGIAARAFESAEAFLADGAVRQPGCVVLDLRMPGISGIELLQRLRGDMNDIPVIMISAHADVPSAVRAMKLGAVDLLQKPVEPVALIDAVRRSLELSRSLQALGSEVRGIQQRFERLTARELELVGFVVDGHANKQIAVDMGISIKTVANHRASLMAKVGAANAADLARLYTIYQSYQGTKPANSTRDDLI